MRTVCFTITIECEDNTEDGDLSEFLMLIEDLVYKNNYELYSSEWEDE